ncbi:MAG: ATP-binding cassette domain-containing protein [Kiritimatiellae bacterium]|nr:ATP-binding cassette domain-containing protein [Kiritimatiellia bacterium]
MSSCVGDVPILRVRDLTVRLGELVVLDHVTFEVPAGAYVGVVGPNGAGKTTLLRAMLNLIARESGVVEFYSPDGHPAQPRIGYLPQSFSLPLPRFPACVEEIVETGCVAGARESGDGRRRRGDVVQAALEAVGLSALRRRAVGSLSGGERQRLLLARALAAEPQLLMLDEPTTALDPAFREAFYRLLEKWNRERRTTILLVTHDTATIGAHAQRLLYLDRSVVFYGTFEQFCASADMCRRFGAPHQHLICHRHGPDTEDSSHAATG